MWGENVISCYALGQYVSHISNIGEHVSGITLGSEDQNIYAFKELQKENKNTILSNRFQYFA